MKESFYERKKKTESIEIEPDQMKDEVEEENEKIKMIPMYLIEIRRSICNYLSMMK